MTKVILFTDIINYCSPSQNVYAFNVFFFGKLVDYGGLAGSPSLVHKLAKNSLHIGDSYYSTGGSEIALLRVARERMSSPMLPNTLAEKK